MPSLLRARCPTCGKPVPVDPADRPQDFPFCSKRCRLLDLHRWLSESYRIPVLHAPSPEDEDSGAAEEPDVDKP